MVKVTEHFIQCHFKTVSKPKTTPSLELSSDRTDMYGWRDVIQALVIPEDLEGDVCQTAVTEGAGLLLHTHLLQHLPRCTSIAQEGRDCAKIMVWCTEFKPRSVSVWQCGAVSSNICCYDLC